MSDRPLLVIDGDSLAHRAFHALPKSIKDGRGRPANMIVGFANMLVTLWDAERPRTVLAASTRSTNSTYRSELFPGYQAGRDFPPELVEQLDRLPELVSSFRFAVGKGTRATRRTTSSPPRPVSRPSAAGTPSSSRATETPSSSPATR